MSAGVMLALGLAGAIIIAQLIQRWFSRKEKSMTAAESEEYESRRQW